MRNNQDDEIAALTVHMPWLKRDEALELLRRYGGSAESVLQLINAVSDEQQPGTQSASTPPPRAQSPGAGKKMEKYFVGGGASSGQIVIASGDAMGAGRGGEVNDVIKSIFDREKQPLDNEDGEGVHAFFGRGRRLGHTATPSPFIASTARQRREVAVKVFRNAYCVDDGPIQEKDSEEGMAFFKALNEGVVPDSIAAMYPTTYIDVLLVDCMQQDAPAATFSAFAGEGHRLSGPTTSTTPTEAAAAPTTPPRVQSATSSGSGTFKLHEGEETTKLAIVNFLGERKEFVVNPMRHTVGDIFTLASQQAQPGALSFELIARDVPPRPLVDKSLTIDSAKLRNATVMMRKA
ncbi:UBX domain-containing protein 1 [Trypanosoma grayi]|uniref:UBX domain-containing protein 1 n=1 Tax=Trypanosoma grayi TaxID=71804 RepID=UPI0004F48036|nr:UBX domain-containing protein 1 [Trypanosoma grayi]KEG09558.1 UBX domain-containing protein 1 [Trypanosoma grayi]